MRLSRLAMLCLGALSLSACGSDKVTSPTLPPLATVRFINALSDTGAVDIRPVDQVEFSASANNLAYRAGTLYQPAEAGVRRFRIFLTSTDINVTSHVMAEPSVTLLANTRVTLLLTGTARTGNIALWVIDDASTPPPAGQIGVRLVNAAPGVVNGYVVNTVTTALPASPTFQDIASLIRSSYINRAMGAAAVRVTDAGSSAVTASGAGPNSPTTLPGEKPAAGVNSQGTVFSVYMFAPGAAGSANSTVVSPSLIWFVDRNPCDDPPVAACIQ